MAKTPVSRKRYHHGNLRRALLDAALELIRTDGLGEVSLRAVARHARVSHAAPYHHFADRAELVAAVAEEGFVLLRNAMLGRMSAVQDPRLRLQESGVGYVLFAACHPAHFRVMFSAELADKTAHPSLRTEAQASRAVLDDAIRQGQLAGVLRAGDPEVLSRTAWALVHGLALLILDSHFGPAPWDPAVIAGLARQLTTAQWEGLRGSPGDVPPTSPQSNPHSPAAVPDPESRS